MAVSTDISKLLADQLFAIYSYNETLMLDKVARRVSRGITDIGWTETKLTDITKLRQELEAITGDISKVGRKGVSDAIVEAYLTGQKSASTDMGIPKNFMQGIFIPTSMQRLILESNNMVAQTSIKILRDTLDAYRDIQAEVAAQVLSGVETRKQAAQRMLNKLADRGITSFVDKAGRNWEMASYAEMATRTVTAHAALQGHLDRQAEIGNDLVVVSAFGATCPICAPWGGEVLSISGKDGTYTSFETARAAGLFHPNCKHTVTAYFPFIDDEGSDHKHERTYEPEQYALQQRQRANERQIRRWKRREIVALSPQAKLQASNYVKHYQGAQRELIKSYEEKFGIALKRKYDRESIKGRAGIPGIDLSPDWTAKRVTKVSIPHKPPKGGTRKPKAAVPVKPIIVRPEFDINSIHTLKGLKARQEEFKQSNSALKDEPTIKKAKKVMETIIADSELRMRVPGQTIMEKILDSGKFKTQMETNTSNGMLDLDTRKRASQYLFGTDTRNTPNDMYEIYGYIGEKDIIADARNAHASQYGDIIVTFKKELRERTTFTIDDSLSIGLHDDAVASRITDIEAVNGMDRKLKRVAALPKDERNVEMAVNNLGVSYIEAQYHGGLNIDMIESVHIDGSGSDDNSKVFNKGILAKLKAIGIKVFNIGRPHWRDRSADWTITEA